MVATKAVTKMTPRKTLLVHGRICYADSLKKKELPSGTTIVYADGVSSYDSDWDRVAKPAQLVIRGAPVSERT